MNINKHFYHISINQSEMFQTKVVNKLKTHILCSITFSPDNRAVYEKM
jgi:hypothetical protein